MNPIENLWNDLEIRLRNRSPQPTNKEDLKLALEDEWYKTSKEYINTLFKGMPRRIQALIDAKGGYTKY